MNKRIIKLLATVFAVILVVSSSSLATFATGTDQGNLSNLPTRSSAPATSQTPEPYTQASGTTAPPAVAQNKTHYHYYGNQLSTAHEKQLYARMEAELLGGKTVTSAVVFDPPVSLSANINNDEAFYTELIGKFGRALDAFKFDHPEVYWTSGGYTLSNIMVGTDYNGNNFLTQASAELDPASVSNDEIQKINSYISQIVNTASQQSTHYERIKSVHDIIANHTSYGNLSNTRAYQVTGALTDRKATCEGYSKAVKMVLDRMGYENTLIGGYSYNNGNKILHMWNYVKIDENWYAIDLTWDDQDYIVYDYLLVGKNTPAPNFGSATFASQHQEVPRFSNVEYVMFSYPQLSANAYR